MTSSPAGPDPAALRALAALDEPSRRALYLYVRSAAGPVTREQAAGALGLSRKVATFHLDRLADAGLLVPDYDRATRHRPLGRLPKVYRPADVEWRVAIPDRRPLVLAEVLLDAVSSAPSTESARDAALRVAEQKGRELGAAAGRGRPVRGQRALARAAAVLAAQGYEPSSESPRCVRLRNCPFQPLAARSTEIVCAINHRMITGVLTGLRAEHVHARLEPRAGECCVEVLAEDGA